MKPELILEKMTFNQIVDALADRIDFHVRTHRGKIPGFEDDDVRQELLIELWKKLDRIPEDMVRIDYRFTRYIETIFNRRIISLHRSLLVARRKGEYRDVMTKATFIGEGIDSLDS